MGNTTSLLYNTVDAGTCPMAASGLASLSGLAGLVGLAGITAGSCYMARARQARRFAPIGPAVTAMQSLLHRDTGVLRFRHSSTPNELVTPLPAGTGMPARVLRTNNNTETLLLSSPVAASAVCFKLTVEAVSKALRLAREGKICVVSCLASSAPGKPPTRHFVLCVPGKHHASVAAAFGCPTLTTLAHRVTGSDGTVRVRGLHTPAGADPAAYGAQAQPWQGIFPLLGREATYMGEATAPKLAEAVAADARGCRHAHFCQILVVPDDTAAA